MADKEVLSELTAVVQKVQSEFAKANLVHRVQFEAEFRSYRNLWRATHRVHKAFVQFKPIPDEIIPITLAEFEVSQNAYAEALDDCRPFIPHEVWQKFHEFDDFMIAAKMLRTDGSGNRANRREVRLVFEECAKTIQERLANLLIV